MSFGFGPLHIDVSDLRLKTRESALESDTRLKTRESALASDSRLQTQDSRLTHDTSPRTRASRLDRAIFILLVGGLVFSALAFGSVEPWAKAVLESIAVLVTALWVIKSFLERQIRLVIPPVLLPVAGLVVWGLIQSIAITGGSEERKAISMDVEASRVAVVSIFFLLLLAVGAANFISEKQAVRRLATFLVFYGLALGVFALIQSFTWEGAFYWLRPTRALNSFGPFANRDHFAGYMEMLAPFPAAMILTGAVRGEQRLAYGFAGIMIFVAILASLSRGGMLSLGVQCVLMATWAVRSPLTNRGGAARSRTTIAIQAAVVSAALAAVIAAGIMWLGPARIINRAASTISDLREEQAGYISRQWIWRDTWSLIKSHPVLGTGIGSFETVFPGYSHNNGRLIIAQSHNDYLQILADCGLIGGARTAWFLVVVLRLMRQAVKTTDRVLLGTGLACSASITGMLVHSLFDFNLQIPSNALLFLFLAAMLSNVVAAARPVTSVQLIRRPDGQAAVPAFRGA